MPFVATGPGDHVDLRTRGMTVFGILIAPITTASCSTVSPISMLITWRYSVNDNIGLGEF